MGSSAGCPTPKMDSRLHCARGGGHISWGASNQSICVSRPRGAVLGADASYRSPLVALSLAEFSRPESGPDQEKAWALPAVRLRFTIQQRPMPRVRRHQRETRGRGTSNGTGGRVQFFSRSLSRTAARPQWPDSQSLLDGAVHGGEPYGRLRRIAPKTVPVSPLVCDWFTQSIQSRRRLTGHRQIGIRDRQRLSESQAILHVRRLHASDAGQISFGAALFWLSQPMVSIDIYADVHSETLCPARMSSLSEQDLRGSPRPTKCSGMARARSCWRNPPKWAGSRTEQYKGYHFDMGGHRFFTKNAEVNGIWRDVLADDFLRRDRLSRIYYNRRFFHYPLRPLNALRGLGVIESLLIFFSYTRWKLFPHKQEDTFEQWVTNRFGKRLFLTFFKTYTEKVWGISCSELKAEWAAQRIKDLSLRTAVLNMFFQPKQTIKTLIGQFDYPVRGPGMLWEAMGRQYRSRAARYTPTAT